MNWVITRRRLPFQEFLAYVERSEREMEFDKIHIYHNFRMAAPGPIGSSVLEVDSGWLPLRASTGWQCITASKPPRTNNNEY